jgi:hypothetical protein
MTTTTCIKCNSTGLVWNQSLKGKWYLGIPVQHSFEDGNTVTTHIAAHNCIPTPEGLAAAEARRAERQAELAAEAARIEAYEAEQNKLSHVAAEVGEVVTLTGVVTMATEIDGHFGTQKLIVLKTDSYEVAKMFTTAAWAWSIDFDDVITVAATVKSHDSYDGKPQTAVTRPKLIKN